MKSKRILSLVLAMIMVLGTFGTVLAEEPEDMSHGEKIQWLVDNGIVEGNETGDLMLDKNIDRASVAKMVVYALDKTSVAQGLRNYPAPFVDVPVNHWSNGNINVVSVEGLMIGNLKSQFMPSAEISYAEVLTVLVRIVDGEIANPVWPTSYIAKAHELGLLDGVALPDDFMKPSNRKDILEMFYNAMVVMEIGNYHIIKGIVLENSRVESIGKDEVVVEVIREMQVADFADESRAEKGDQERYVIDPKVGDVEDLLGKVADFSLNKDGKVVKVTVDDSYTYFNGPISVSRTKVNSYTVELDERFKESDERIFRTYHNDKAYSYQDFYRMYDDKDMKKIDFAKVTVKNGKVLFIDSFTFDDIAPVQEVRRDGLDVYVYNDYRDARLEKFEPRALVLGYNNGTFSRIEREDVKENDVVHVYENNRMIVRLDAAITGEYEKVQRDRSNNYYAHIDGKGYLINDVNYRRPVYAHDSKSYTTLYAKEASRDLENFFREEVSILIDINGDLQLFGADVEYNEGMAIVKQILARGQVKFVKRDNEEVVLNEDFGSSISDWDEIGETTINQRLNNFNTQDLTFVLGDDDTIQRLVRIAKVDKIRSDAKALKSGESSDMNNSFIRMEEPFEGSPTDNTGKDRYQVLDRTNVFHINKNGAISASTVAKYQASLSDKDNVKAFVLSDEQVKIIYRDAGISDRNRITDENDIAHTIVFVDLNLKGTDTSGETMLVTNVYTARTPHYVVGYGPDSDGKKDIERIAAPGVNLLRAPGELLTDDIVSLNLTKDDDKLVRSFDVLIAGSKVKTDSYRVIGGNLQYSANEYRRLELEDGEGKKVTKWLVRGVEEFGTITIDSVVTFHETKTDEDIDVIRVYPRSTPVTANVDQTVYETGIVTYKNGAVGSEAFAVDNKTPYFLDAQTVVLRDKNGLVLETGAQKVLNGTDGLRLGDKVEVETVGDVMTITIVKRKAELEDDVLKSTTDSKVLGALNKVTNPFVLPAGRVINIANIKQHAEWVINDVSINVNVEVNGTKWKVILTSQATLSDSTIYESMDSKIVTVEVAP